MASRRESPDVPAYRTSAQAESDLDAIATYTTSAWGLHQTDLYLSKLEDGFRLLAQNPAVGRPCDTLLLGLRRFEIGRHVVFYLDESPGIFIVRVLHQQMLPSNYF